jgi:hypothetical protein
MRYCGDLHATRRGGGTMTMELTAAFVVFLAVAVWVFVRRQTLRWDGPLADVPDALPTSEPIEAPGLTLPYTSVDPFAPPKQLGEPDKGRRNA